MNILFILRGNGIGGVEIVTQMLANTFVNKEHNISIFIFHKESDASFTDRLDQRIKLYQHNKYASDRETVSKLRNFILENKTQIIINQWGLPFVPIRTAKKATKGLNIPIVSFYHNAPDANGRIQGINIKLAQTKNPFKQIFLKTLRYAFRKVTGCSMRYNYQQSDKFLVLSESYIKVFQNFTHLHDTPKLGVMTNPITIDNGNFICNTDEKEKEIIYVGRLDAVQKCVGRVIDTWALIEEKHSDWRLTIVGDGPDRTNLENKVSAAGLKHVSFAGFQKSLPYYLRASILVLTSDFEGFPLVLAEAMSCGVVPVVYDSFAAVRDIIDTGKDGVIVLKESMNFSAKLMAKGVEQIIEDFETNGTMAQAAVNKSNNYSIETIYGNWMKLFQELKVKN